MSLFAFLTCLADSQTSHSAEHLTQEKPHPDQALQTLVQHQWSQQGPSAIEFILTLTPAHLEILSEIMQNQTELEKCPVADSCSSQEKNEQKIKKF